MQSQATNCDASFIGKSHRIDKRRNRMLEQGFVYLNQLEPIAGTDGFGNVVATFVYADKPHAPSYLLKNGNVYRVISDYLGSVRLVINVADGQVVQALDYDEYGNVTEDTNPGFQPFGYAGGIYDRDLGFVRFGARDYGPVIGRWVTKDRIGLGPGQTNLFEYGRCDPVNYFDKDGRATQIIAVIFVAAVVAVAAYATIQAAKAMSEAASQGLFGNPTGLEQPFEPLVNPLVEPLDPWMYSETERPEQCPTGTLPIDKAKSKFDLDKDGVHSIKERVGAGPRTWTGIEKDGNVWTGTPDGLGEKHGHYTDYLP